MSNIEPDPGDLPDFLTQAILSVGPPADAVDLVKNAVSWRTIDADLLEVSFDSAGEPAVVREAGDSRTLELQAEQLSVIIEIGDRLTGQVVPPAIGTVELKSLGQSVSTSIEDDGRFVFEDPPSGPVRLRITGTRTFESSTFTI